MADGLNVGSISWRIKANADEAKESLDNLSDSVGNLNKLFGLFKISAFVAGLKSIATTIGNVTSKQSEYIQTSNLFNKTMGQSINAAKEFRDQMQTKLGIDPADTMASMTAIQRLTETFGISSENAYIMSKNLTQLAADMTSYGYSFENAMQKLKSGLSGKIICLVYKGLYTVTHLIAGKSKRIMT